jgi:4-hydroxy-3-polyprenylbenzoate decarboxylase
MTGASGHIYAEGLIRALVAAGHRVDLSLSGAGLKVLRHELGIDLAARADQIPARIKAWLGPEVAAHVTHYPAVAIEAPPASGTALTGVVVLCPCSMGTLARVAAGFSSNLVERAADVALKEGRSLLIVPREAPFSEIHLENLLKLARMGAVILPAAPGFYHHPKSIADLVDHLVGKIMDRMGLEHAPMKRWSGELEPAPEAGTEPPLGEPS